MFDLCFSISGHPPQPSSEVFGLFDQLCLLSAGRLVYFGKATECLTMFEAAGLPCPALRNPTDHFLHCINADFKTAGHSEDDVEKLLSVFNENYNPALLEKVKSLSALAGEYKGNVNEASPVYQTWIVTKRTFLNNLRNIGVFWLRLGMYICLCIMIGTIFLKLGTTWQDTYSFTSLLFFVVAVSCTSRR